MAMLTTRSIPFVASALMAASVVAAKAEHITFTSAARNSQVVQIFQGKTEYTDRIYGDLRLPSKGSGPFPAMVIMPSSRGIVPTIDDWAKMFNGMGVATFVVDSLAPRGLAENNADQLTFPAGVVDSLRAFDILRHDVRIDPTHIGVIGFSRGAIAAMDSSFERYRAAVLTEAGNKFALHIVFYGGCAQYAQTTGSPILNFLGTEDDFNNLDLCRRDTEILKQQGTKAELVIYDGALHGFDTDYPRQSMPMIQNFRNCAMLQNLDTFEATLPDGRVLSPDERTSYGKSCVRYGAVRGGDRNYALAARERVKQFVTEHFELLH